MRNAIFATCSAVAVVGAISLSAQTTPAPSPSSPSAPQTTAAPSITVTGCLKPWDGSAMGTTSGTTTPGATSASPAKFLLTNVVDPTAGRSGAPGAGTTGTTTPAPADRMGAGADAKQYSLTASSSVNLAEHLNHQVRVTGTLSPAASSTMGTMGTTPSRPGDPARPGEPMRPGETARPGETGSHAGMGAPNAGTITVSSVTMVNATCTGASF